MKQSKKITDGINVNLKKSAAFNHTIQGFINMKKIEAEPNDAFKLHYDKVYKNMDIDGGEASYEAIRPPKIEVKHQINKNKLKWTRWRQCVS